MSQSLQLLRRHLARLAPAFSPAPPAACVPSGAAALDAAIGGGFARGRLHEFLAGEDADSTALSGLAAGLCVRSGGHVLWLRDQAVEALSGRLYPPGLIALGLDPSRLILMRLSDPRLLLVAAAEALGCKAMGLVVIELRGQPRALDLTASRRLALAADRHGVTALLLRSAARDQPSAAWTRWHVISAPSGASDAAASGAPPWLGPGRPAWQLSLIRRRDGPAGGQWRVEWDEREAAWRDLDAGSGQTIGRGHDRPIPASGSRAALPRGRAALSVG